MGTHALAVTASRIPDWLTMTVVCVEAITHALVATAWPILDSFMIVTRFVEGKAFTMIVVCVEAITHVLAVTVSRIPDWLTMIVAFATEMMNVLAVTASLIP